MTPVRVAAIDVGTNSVKLLVADPGPPLRAVLETGTQTRLGEGFYPDRILQPAAIARTVQAVQQLVERARRVGAARFRLFATSAAREARNQDELRQALETLTGIPLEVISGQQEARWAFLGARTHPDLSRAFMVVVEVGGGSTQIIAGQHRQILFQASHPWGAVRLWEQAGLSDPPAPEERARLKEQLRQAMEAELVPAFREHVRVASDESSSAKPPLPVAVGGTALTLARIRLATESWDRRALEQLRLSRAELRTLTDRLWSTPLARRRQWPGLPPERADIILTGSLIYEQLTETLGFESWRFSTRGLRFGAILDLLENQEATPFCNQPAALDRQPENPASN